MAFQDFAALGEQGWQPQRSRAASAQPGLAEEDWSPQAGPVLGGAERDPQRAPGRKIGVGQSGSTDNPWVTPDVFRRVSGDAARAVIPYEMAWEPRYSYVPVGGGMYFSLQGPAGRNDWGNWEWEKKGRRQTYTGYPNGAQLTQLRRPWYDPWYMPKDFQKQVQGG